MVVKVDTAQGAAPAGFTQDQWNALSDQQRQLVLQAQQGTGTSSSGTPIQSTGALLPGVPSGFTGKITSTSPVQMAYSPTQVGAMAQPGGLQAIGQVAAGEQGGIRNVPPTTPSGAPPVSTRDAAITAMNGWDDTRYQQFKTEAIGIGLVTADATRDDVTRAWAWVVDSTVLYDQDTGNVLSPDQLWEQLKGSSTLRGQMVLDPRDEGLSQTTSMVKAFKGSTSGADSVEVSHMDPFTASGVLEDTFGQMIGRAPTAAEQKAFLQALYTSESAAPIVKTQTVTGATPSTPGGATGTTGQILPSNASDPNTAVQTQLDAQSALAGQTTTDTTQQRGMTYGVRGPTYLAEQSAKVMPEYGAYQAATTYMNALKSLLTQGPLATPSASFDTQAG